MKVGVVLINWNGGEFTIPCIESLKAGSIKPDLIVVVDNASIDGSPERIQSTFPDMELIRNASNNGFAGANNQGIQLLLERGMDYIWVLNNDTAVAQDCLEVMLGVAKKYPDAAGLTGKIFYDYPPDRIWYAGGYRHPLHLGPKHREDPGLDNKTKDGAVEVAFISGCSMLVPSGAWRRLGGFVEDYVIYSEDSEWCWRAINAGATLLYIPKAVLWHKLGATVTKNLHKRSRSKTSPRIVYLTRRNHIWSIRKHATGLSKWISLGISIGAQIRNMGRYLLKADLDLLRSNAKGLTDGLFTEVPAARSFTEN
jgi:GT2 family glycosyltransferase